MYALALGSIKCYRLATASKKNVKCLICLRKKAQKHKQDFLFLSREGIEPPSASYRPILLQRTTITIRSSALFLFIGLDCAIRGRRTPTPTHCWAGRTPASTHLWCRRAYAAQHTIVC